MLDSSEVINLIDSAYILVRVPETYLSTIIDAAYVQSRQTAQDFAYGSLTGAPTIPTLGTDFVDSGQVTAIVDSAYVAARTTASTGTDSAAIIHDGKVVAQDSPNNLINNINARKAYFGDSFRYS